MSAENFDLRWQVAAVASVVLVSFAVLFEVIQIWVRVRQRKKRLKTEEVTKFWL